MVSGLFHDYSIEVLFDVLANMLDPNRNQFLEVILVLLPLTAQSFELFYLI